jgi:hypothetical protein
MVVSICCAAWISLYSATGLHKKSSNAVAFLNVALMWRHCKNRKQLCVGGNIWESNVVFWGECRFDFLVMGEKELSNVGQNGWWQSWSQLKICAIHTQNFTYCSTYQCTPYSIPSNSSVPKWKAVKPSYCETEFGAIFGRIYMYTSMKSSFHGLFRCCTYYFALRSCSWDISNFKYWWMHWVWDMCHTELVLAT